MLLAATEDRAKFDALEPLVQHALAVGGQTHTVEDVWEAIVAGKAQLWLGPHSLVVTEVQDAPRKKTLHWWLAAGRLEELAAMEHGILGWGKTQGCSRATLAGRKGWERVWATRHWRPTLSVLEREIP